MLANEVKVFKILTFGPIRK